MLPTKYRFIWPSCFRGDFFRNQPIRNKNGLWWPCLLADRDEMTNLDRGPARCFLPSFGSFGKAISEQIFKYRPMRKQNCLCRPCLLTDRDINQQYLQRTFQGWFLPRFDSFGREVSEEKIFQRSTNQKHELPVAAMFVYGSQLDEQSLQSPSKDAYYQISIHLAKGFQRRRFFRN